MARFTEKDKEMMRMAFSLAFRGWGKVSPNPMVGAVVAKGNKVVGKGYHRQYGSPHAETQAIKAAKGLAKGATIYLNLEPCNHFGKTPPCTEAIIKAGIKDVVCSNKDIDPHVKGNGFAYLKKNGINVRSGLMVKEGLRLNEAYFKYKATGLPFVVLKAAMSLDGFIYSNNFGRRYLTSDDFLGFVHHLRAGYDAVLIGAKTAMIDNPKLNVRLVKGRNPVRIILSDGRNLPSDLAIMARASEIRTILAVPSLATKTNYGNNIEVWSIKSRSKRFSIGAFLERAGKEGISSILVEGGSEVFGSFLQEKMVDKVVLAHIPSLFGGGVPFIKSGNSHKPAGIIDFESFHWSRTDNESIFIGYPIFVDKKALCLPE